MTFITVFFLFLTGVALLYVLFALYLENRIRQDIRFSYVPEKDLKILYQITKDTHEILEEVGIPYWAMAGTLLGAMRHDAIIPWDDDVDIMVPEEHESRLLSLKQKFKDRGYHLISGVGCYKIIYPQGKLCLLTNTQDYIYNLGREPFTRYPFLDIFIVSKKGNKYDFKHHIPRYLYSHEVIYSDEVGKRPLVKFGPIKIRVPEKSKQYLNRVFGSKWKEDAVISHIHRYQVKFFNPIKFKLQ